MMIEMFPPAGYAPFKRFKLASGREVEPNIEKGGAVVVHSMAEELELMRESWSPEASKLDVGDLKKFARAGLVAPTQKRMRDADLRKRAVAASIRHFNGREVDRRIVFGEVNAGRFPTPAIAPC